MMRMLRLLPIVFLFAASTLRAQVEPVGEYILSGQPGTGIHIPNPSGDALTMNGILIFNSSSQLTYASLTFTDPALGESFVFNEPGATTITTAFPATLSAEIGDSTDPFINYFFAIGLPAVASPTGSFTLTCGVDCDTYVSEGPTGPNPNYYNELTGTITPATPEPSSFVLLGTGVVGAAGMLRRRLRGSPSPM